MEINYNDKFVDIMATVIQWGFSIGVGLSIIVMLIMLFTFWKEGYKND